LTPFAFHNPFDVAAGRQIGSNYDHTGNNTQGRETVVFRGNWAQVTDMCRSSVQGLELVEVASLRVANQDDESKAFATVEKSYASLFFEGPSEQPSAITEKVPETATDAAIPYAAILLGGNKVTAQR
jgi:hypothetical protein